MLHVFYGSDDYSITLESNSLVARLKGDGVAPVARYDGTANAWPAIREACQSLSLFAPTQVVLVRGLLGQWSGRGDGAGRADGGGKSAMKPTPSEFAAFVAALAATTDLILLDGALSATNRYLKELSALPKNAVAIKTFSLPEGVARQQWIQREVTRRGGSIEAGVADFLARRCSGDLWMLSGEIDKLLAYAAPQHKIVREDVLLLTPADDEVTGFQLLEALAGKRLRDVVDLLDRLLAGGEAPEALLALVGARLRDLTLLEAGQAEGLSRDEIASRAGWNPGRLGHVQRSLGQFSAQELLEARGVLVATDQALKSRPAHERPVVMLLSSLVIAQRRGAGDLVAALAYA